MPVIKSSGKRVRQTIKKTARNVHLKRNIRLATQVFEKAIESGKEVTGAQSKLDSLLDKAGKRNVFHKNKVARRKSAMARKAKAAGMGKKRPPKTAATKTSIKNKQ